MAVTNPKEIMTDPRPLPSISNTPTSAAVRSPSRDTLLVDPPGRFAVQ